MRQLLEPANADDDHIPLYDYAFSAASNGPPPQGTPSHVRTSAPVPNPPDFPLTSVMQFHAVYSQLLCDCVEA